MKFTKLISTALVSAIIATTATSFAFGSSNALQLAKAGTDKDTVKILTNVTGGKDADEMLLFAEALSEATGLNIEMEKPASDFTQTLMQKLNSGEKLDLIYLNHTDMINLYDQDVLMDITDMVKDSKIMQENINQSEWDDIEIDGKYYAGFNKTEVFIPVNVNKAHLAKAGIDYLEIEPTLDGYYETMKALKEAIDTPDYYPLNVVLSDCWDIQPWMAAVGLKGGITIDPDDGKRIANYSTPEAAPVWEWLSKLYAEELLDPSCAVDKTKDMREKMGAASQLTSIDVDWIAWIGLHNGNASAGNIAVEDFEIAPLPGIKTPDGNYMIRKGNASLWGIPVNANNPEGAFKVLEFFATQEGGELLTIGVEGYDYIMVGDECVMTEIGLAHSYDHGAPFPIYKDFVHLKGYNLGVEEGLQYLEYSSIEMPLKNESEYKEIMGNWGVQIVRGDISVDEGLQKMNAELIARGLTDK